MLTLSLLVLSIQAPPPVALGIDGGRFTIDGEPRFLLGASYYAGLGASDEHLAADLDALRERGFNWIRLWVTWSGFVDVSAVDRTGAAREPYLGRLTNLLEACRQRGMIVDVTFSRGQDLPDQASHLRAVRVIAEAIRPYRNAYIDLANERDVRDARYVSYEELGELAAAVRAIDPERLITASGVPEEDNIERYLRVATLDFVCPHLGRSADSPARTESWTGELLGWMTALGQVVPVHYQEPFRRGYSGGWEPTVEDFLTDLRGAIRGGAAGWCFHNGSVRNAGGDHDGRPRRSFDLTEQSLFAQLDEVELALVDRAAAAAREAGAAL